MEDMCESKESFPGSNVNSFEKEYPVSREATQAQRRIEKEDVLLKGNESQTGISNEEDDALAVAQEIALSRVRNQAQELKKQLLVQMDTQISAIIEEYVSEVESVRMPRKYRSFVGDAYAAETVRKKSSNGVLPEKEFVARNSLLTDLFEISHIQTIYHIFIAILLLLFINTTVEDIVDRGKIDWDFALISWAFGDMQTVLMTWVKIGMTCCALIIVYPAFHFWSHQRLSIANNFYRLCWDYLWLSCYIIYFGAAIYIPLKESIVHRLPPASAVTLLMEQVRMLMKTHAFVRENIPIAIGYYNLKKKDVPREGGSPDDDLLVPCPDFSRYLYFMFAPTLVYRNRYPRTRSIRWKWVVWNFLQVVGVLFYLYFIFVRFCVPVFRQIGHESMSGKALVLAVFGCMLPGTLVLLCGFFCLLHSWLNAFAEMLRFADRMFYQDWWNSSTYASYYRTWNVVVHDWLYTYVYKDMYNLCGKRSRVIPMVTVFLISSMVHEYIITFTFRCFYPILLLMFGGFGMLFAFITNIERRLGNIFMWLTLFIGTGLFMSLYSMEWYARINCPPTFDGFLDVLVPRSWTCITLN